MIKIFTVSLLLLLLFVVVVFMKKFTVFLFSQDSLSVLWALSSMSTGEQWQRSRPGSERFRLWVWTKVKTSIMTSEYNYWNPCLYNLDQKCMKVLKNRILIRANESMLLMGFLVTVKKTAGQSISLSCRNMLIQFKVLFFQSLKPESWDTVTGGALRQH